MLVGLGTLYGAHGWVGGWAGGVSREILQKGFRKKRLNDVKVSDLRPPPYAPVDSPDLHLIPRSTPRPDLGVSPAFRTPLGSSTEPCHRVRLPGALWRGVNRSAGSLASARPLPLPPEETSAARGPARGICPVVNLALPACPSTAPRVFGPSLLAPADMTKVGAETLENSFARALALAVRHGVGGSGNPVGPFPSGSRELGVRARSAPDLSLCARLRTHLGTRHPCGASPSMTDSGES